MYDHVCLCDTSSDGARPYGKVVSDFPPLGEGSLSRSYVIDLGWAQDVISGVTCQSFDSVFRLHQAVDTSTAARCTTFVRCLGAFLTMNQIGSLLNPPGKSTPVGLIRSVLPDSPNPCGKDPEN